MSELFTAFLQVTFLQVTVHIKFLPLPL